MAAHCKNVHNAHPDALADGEKPHVPIYTNWKQVRDNWGKTVGIPDPNYLPYVQRGIKITKGSSMCKEADLNRSEKKLHHHLSVLPDLEELKDPGEFKYVKTSTSYANIKC